MGEKGWSALRELGIDLISPPATVFFYFSFWDSWTANQKRGTWFFLLSTMSWDFPNNAPSKHLHFWLSCCIPCGCTLVLTVVASTHFPLSHWHFKQLDMHQGTNTHLPAMPCLHILDGCIFVMPCNNLSYQCSSRFSPSVVGLTYHIHPFMLHPTAFFHCDLCRDNTCRSEVHKPLTWFLIWNTYVLAKEMQASCSDLCTSLLWQPAWCYPCDCNVWTL